MMLLVRDEIGTDDDQQVESANGERRRGLRVRQSRPIKVLDLCAGRIFGGQTRDVSATGLQIELPAHAPVRVGDLLSIHVGVGLRRNVAGEPAISAAGEDRLDRPLAIQPRDADGGASSMPRPSVPSGTRLNGCNPIH